MTMQVLMVGTAERYGELIADLPAQGARLRKFQVMGIGRGLFTYQAGLFTYKEQMALASSPQLLGKCQACLRSAGGCCEVVLRARGGLQQGSKLS